MAFLEVQSGAEAGTRYEIDRDETRIGRLSDNEVTIDDASVSSRHCTVLRDGRRFTLRDLGSTNGTHLNGAAVREQRLSPGDIFAAGSVEVRIDGEDIEPYNPTQPKPGERPLSAVKRGPTDTVRTEPVFDVRTSKRWLAVLLGVLLALGVLGAMALFAYRLFSG